jgi:hypothetical protein
MRSMDAAAADASWTASWVWEEPADRDPSCGSSRAGGSELAEVPDELLSTAGVHPPELGWIRQLSVPYPEGLQPG